MERLALKYKDALHALNTLEEMTHPTLIRKRLLKLSLLKYRNIVQEWKVYYKNSSKTLYEPYTIIDSTF